MTAFARPAGLSIRSAAAGRPPAPRRPPEPPAPRSLRPFLGFGVVIVLAILATAGYKSWRDLATAQAHEAELRARIAATEARIEVLARRQELLERDPATLERLAREELGMVRPGDVVIVLPADDTP